MLLHHHLLSFFTLASAAISVNAVVGTANLTLPHLFSLEIQVTADQHTIKYPYGGGVRVNAPLLSGSMTTPTNGTVATIVSGLGGDQGVIREDGVLLIDARLVVQVERSLDPDRRFAFLQARGKFTTAADNTSNGLNFIELETDSPPLAYLNRYFLVGKSWSDALTLNIDVYGADPSTF